MRDSDENEGTLQKWDVSENMKFERFFMLKNLSLNFLF